jgi:hypothetical protein
MISRLLLLRNDDDDYIAGISDRVTHIGGTERAWTPSPYGPRTFEENLRLLELSRRWRAKRPAAS